MEAAERLAPVPGSFRDPSGHVFESGGRIYRTIAGRAADEYRSARDSGLLERLAGEGWIVAAREVDPAVLGAAAAEARHVVEHPVVPFVSFPYEWPFPALKAAALLHLDLPLRLLDEGMTLSDASAYNVQFRGPRPVFIDTLSLRRYREGEFWLGHSQFCEQFLNPLLLRALLGVPHNAWYRGALEGIATSELARLLPARRRLSWNVLSHVVLPARLQRAALEGRRGGDVAKLRGRRLPRGALMAMLRQLRRWIARLEPADTGRTVWGDYARTHTYTAAGEAAKRALVARFVGAVRPALLVDLGCNTGEYGAVALGAGAGAVVGFDFDQRALEAAYARAAAEGLDLLPLVLDAANPSPDQGWRQAERPGFGRRVAARADAVLALAFGHHLAIGRNVPLDQFLAWLTGLAPCGVVEFVPKGDPTVQRMLALREDIFADYDEANFRSLLGRRARIVEEAAVSDTGRRLLWYEAHAGRGRGRGSEP